MDNNYHKYHWKNIGIIVLVCFLTTIGMISNGITIFDIIKNNS